MLLTVFQVLIQCRKDVCEQLSLDPATVELSMGMSNDFEHAVSICHLCYRPTVIL